jgi:hypothetical protein
MAVAFIDEGFEMLESECVKFEYRIDCMTEGYFRRHECTEEELLYSHNVDTIKAITGKLGRYVRNLEVRGELSPAVRNYYEEKMDVLKQRMAYIFNKIRSRKKTFWDCGRDLLFGSYYFIFNIAFYHFKNFIIPSMTDSGKFAGIFSTFGRASKDFEDFLYDTKGKSKDNGGGPGEAKYSESKRA